MIKIVKVNQSYRKLFVLFCSVQILFFTKKSYTLEHNLAISIFNDQNFSCVELSFFDLDSLHETQILNGILSF